MVPISALWLPIVLSAVIVFVASFFMHHVLKYHQSDCKRLPDEPKVLAALRDAGLTRGFYMFPYATHKDIGSPEMLEKFKQGPVGTMTLRDSGVPAMGKFLGMGFVYCLIIGFFVAYLTGRTVAPGAPYLAVHRAAGCAAFMAYGLGNLANSSWKGQPWGMTIKEVIDGLIYGALTGGTFGWLWPR